MENATILTQWQEGQMPPKTDEALAIEAQNGNWNSYEELYERYHAALHRVLERGFPTKKGGWVFISCKQCREDIIEETFSQAVMGFDESKGSFKDYLYAILKNKAMDHLGKCPRCKGVKFLLEDFDTEATFGKGNEIDWNDHPILQEHPFIHIRELPKDKQDIFILVSLLEYAYDDAAQKLGLPDDPTTLGKLRKRHHDACKKLGELILKCPICSPTGTSLKN